MNAGDSPNAAGSASASTTAMALEYKVSGRRTVTASMTGLCMTRGMGLNLMNKRGQGFIGAPPVAAASTADSRHIAWSCLSGVSRDRRLAVIGGPADVAGYVSSQLTKLVKFRLASANANLSPNGRRQLRIRFHNRPGMAPN